LGASEGQPQVAEFFAGIGLARLGLEVAGFRVSWSNDIEPTKRDMYTGHFRDDPATHKFVLSDIADVKANDLPHGLSLAWASFPCIDLSLAGWRRGLNGTHSSTFWSFAQLMDDLADSRPGVVVLENVVGLATSHDGTDLVAAIGELNRLGYSADVLTIDARRFVPQSRPRLFIVGAQDREIGEAQFDETLRPEWLRRPFEDPSLRTHRFPLPDPPPLLTDGLASIVETVPLHDPLWWDNRRTAAFISSLSATQLSRLEVLRSGSKSTYRTAYRRTRDGKPMWEIRSDGVAGCLRTARGGSSKQALVEAGNGSVRVRWMTPSEYARLMGANDYKLDGLRRNQALDGFGDAVCVPVITWLAEHYLMPLVRGAAISALQPLLAAASA
jgi:DNA (cytosine-5)-methyltransferase 1